MHLEAGVVDMIALSHTQKEAVMVCPGFPKIDMHKCGDVHFPSVRRIDIENVTRDQIERCGTPREYPWDVHCCESEVSQL
jgi:hypothetical protein